MKYLAAPRNPYIIGRPIREPENFFGRESLFRFIEDNLYHGVKVILLYGQRRIGKSSVLQQIPNFITRDKFVFVLFDLQDKSRENLSSILHNLALAILAQTDIDEDKVRVPTEDELEDNLDEFDRIFLPKIYQKIGNRILVLLLDEFDVLGNTFLDKTKNHLDFFSYFQKLLRQQEKLAFIPVIGRKVSDFSQLLNLFKNAPYQEIGFLDDVSAKRLITKPAEGILIYDPDAIQSILKLSAGHPYFIQVICFCIFVRARQLDEWHINFQNIDDIVDRAIENAEAGLAWFWDGLTIPEQVIFSAVAESQTVIEKPFKLLEKYGVIKTEALEKAVEQLVASNFLEQTCDKIKIELVHRWLVQRHPLPREIKELKIQKSQIILLGNTADS
ncbi:MAG: hypothetical protein RMX65_035380 [Nostoc sp. DedQUE01]|nr:ATP-binding protein [Nostoc sp. DedQUE01]